MQILIDVAVDAMDSPALLHVALAKLKTVTTLTTLKRSNREEDDHTQNWILWNFLSVFVHILKII